MKMLIGHWKWMSHFVGLTMCCLTLGVAQAKGQPAAAPVGTESSGADANVDPYLWLEDVTGERSLNWVRQQNALSTNELQFAAVFEPDYAAACSRSWIPKHRIPYVAKHGRWCYNFWRDQKTTRARCLATNHAAGVQKDRAWTGKLWA